MRRGKGKGPKAQRRGTASLGRMARGEVHNLIRLVLPHLFARSDSTSAANCALVDLITSSLGTEDRLAVVRHVTPLTERGEDAVLLLSIGERDGLAGKSTFKTGDLSKEDLLKSTVSRGSPAIFEAVLEGCICYEERDAWRVDMAQRAIERKNDEMAMHILTRVLKDSPSLQPVYAKRAAEKKRPVVIAYIRNMLRGGGVTREELDDLLNLGGNSVFLDNEMEAILETHGRSVAEGKIGALGEERATELSRHVLSRKLKADFVSVFGLGVWPDHRK